MAKRVLDTRDDIRVVTSNNFLRATGLEKISLRARKLLYIALAQSRFNDKKLFEYTISAKEFASLTGVQANHIYEEADKITDELMKGFVKYRPFGRREFVKHQLFKTCRYVDGDLTFELSEEMTPIVLNLRHDFSMPLLHDFLQMRSNYSRRPRIRPSNGRFPLQSCGNGRARRTSSSRSDSSSPVSSILLSGRSNSGAATASHMGT